MNTFNTDIVTVDGAMDCFVAHPDGPGPFAPIILYMDVPGIREELRDFARRLADDGFLCVLPDLYYREGKVRFDLSKGESELKKMFAIGSTLSNAMVMRDTQAILDYLAALDVAGDLTGTVGYCMSGQFVISAAGTFPERIRATASLYGTRMVTDKDDSPHKLIPHMRGEVYLGFAEHDPYVEDFVVGEMTGLLESNAALTHLLETHPGTEHGFCFPQRPGYKRDAAESVWQLMVNMYRRSLA
jgi:carboxymethylenebutenolidase